MVIPVILVTGGSSGLGLEIVKKFIDKGFFVVATGRNERNIPVSENRFRFYRVDFCNLRQTAETIKKICLNHKPDYVINNAGILSPPRYTLTPDGYEYTFQVNFLAHLIINEIIIRNKSESARLCIASVTSMVHRLAKTDLKVCRNKDEYTPLGAYSDSKFFLSLMSRYLSVHYHEHNITSFSLDPGIFGSSIYRMQRGWFRVLYRIAVPFMRSPARVAEILADRINDPGLQNGALYDTRGRIRVLKETDNAALAAFWTDCRDIAAKYMD